MLSSEPFNLKPFLFCSVEKSYATFNFFILFTSSFSLTLYFAGETIPAVHVCIISLSKES